MKKTQKLLSLVVVLALALSVCSLSASAKEIITSETKTNIITETFDGLSTISTSTNLKNSEGTATAKPAAVTAGSLEETADGKVLVIGDGSASGRFTVDFNTERTEGLYEVAFKFMTPDTPGSQTMRFYGAGTSSGQSTITSTISNGVEKVGNVTIAPGTWYNFEARIDLDNNTFVATIEGETVYSNTNFTSNLRRPFDTTSSGNTGRTIKYDDFVVNQITSQDKITDGVTNYLYDDFNTAGAITAGTTKFNNAAGTAVATTTSTANATKVDGYLQVGNGTSGRLHLTAITAPTTGTYTVSFKFRTPDEGAGRANLYIYGNNLIGGGSIYAHSPASLNGKEGIWVNNANQYTIESNTWYDFDCTMDLDAGTWVATVNDKIVKTGTFTANTALNLLVNYGQNNNSRTIHYDDFVINQITKDYDVMSVTKDNGTIKARFVCNAAPAATFFAAIYENGTLTSLKAISNVENLEEKTVGTYSVADAADVEVKFYTWAKNGLMPLAAVK